MFPQWLFLLQVILYKLSSQIQIYLSGLFLNVLIIWCRNIWLLIQLYFPLFPVSVWMQLLFSAENLTNIDAEKRTSGAHRCWQVNTEAKSHGELSEETLPFFPGSLSVPNQCQAMSRDWEDGWPQTKLSLEQWKRERMNRSEEAQHKYSKYEFLKQQRNKEYEIIVLEGWANIKRVMRDGKIEGKVLSNVRETNCLRFPANLYFIDGITKTVGWVSEPSGSHKEPRGRSGINLYSTLWVTLPLRTWPFTSNPHQRNISDWKLQTKQAYFLWGEEKGTKALSK